MSALTDLLRDLLVRGVELSLEDGKLIVGAAAGALTPEELAALRGHKQELLRLLPEYRFEAPLSADQEGLWFIQQSAPDSTAYNVAFTARIESEADHRPALRRALQKLIDRHALLRTAYATIDGSPRQVVHGHRALELVEVPAEHLSLEEVRSAATEIHQRPFDLEQEGAFRACLFRRGPRESVLLLGIHHIAIDGWSLYLLVDELIRLFAADGQANPLLPLGRTYQQFVAWQRDLLAARGEELRRAWRDELAGAPQILALPTDRPRPRVQTFRGATRRSSLPPALVDGLRKLARSQHTTLSTVVLTAYQVLLHRYSGQEELCVGFGVSRRDREELAGTFGYMVNQLVIRSRMSAEDAPAFLALVGETRGRVMRAMSRQDYPFRWLVKDLAPDRDPGRPPLVQVAFVYQRMQALSEATVGLHAGASVVVAGARWTPLPVAQVTSEVELTLEVTEHAAGLDLGLRYNSDLFDAATIERMARHLETLLAAAAADPARPAAQLALLTESERHQLLVEWNRTEAPFSSEACIHELFEAHVDRAPDAPALVDLCDATAGPRGTTVSYGELDRRANRIAHHLIRLGVGPEVRVGVCLPRGAELIAAVLGVLKAGGACVVLDPEHPPRRLAALLEDTGVPVVLARGASRVALPETGVRVVEVDRELGDAPVHRPARRARATDLAYVLFTSGSTGRPNGALIEHRGLVNSIEAHIRVMETGPDTRQVHVLSFNFDAAFAHLFDTICAGGALYLVPRDGELLGAGLVALMAREAITHISLVPSMLAALPDAELPALRTIVVGGEPCSAELVARWGARRRFLNLYGPTEATILATAARCLPDGSRPAIGRPIANLRAYIVDRWGQLAPPGAIGELWLGGAGVARGYLNRPELTAEKFVADPFAGTGRLYRTGDLVRYRMAEGGPPVLEFIGRADTQVKIRGHRIELGEVEGALRASPQVRAAVATILEGPSPRLVAYVTPASAQPPRQWELDQVDAWNAMAIDRASPAAPDESDEPDLLLDLRGWKSSLTGAEIPVDEMRAWVEATVARILALAPREVLEIGCGTGMLLARIAPAVQRYRATDLARHAIEHVERLLARVGGLSHVTVSQQPAHELGGLAGERFDTVILNSVVQYFPSARYLLGVLEGLLALTRPGGAIFLGDLRNLALLETYHAAVELARTGGALPRRELRDRVQRAMVHENELVVHPRFFTALRGAFPQITDVEIVPKRGWDRNELSLFRYDVILRIGAQPAAPAPSGPLPTAPSIEWREAGAAGPTLAELRDWIARSGPGRALGLRGIHNARLHEANAWQRWLTGDGEDGHQPWRPPAADPHALEPEALYQLAAELSCRIQLSWAAGRPDGSYDAIVTTGDAPAPRFALDPPPAASPIDELTNDPLQGRRHRELAADLIRELREALPPHLVPSAIVVLPALPLTQNGKVDVRALPSPDAARDPRDPDAQAEPRTEVERTLAEIWCGVLGLPRIGIHDNFFELGGDSVLSILIISRAQARGISLRASQIFAHQTIAKLAAVVEGLAAPREQGAVSGPVPLTPIQRWFFAQELPAPAHFNQAFFLETPGDLDPDLLAQALRHVLGHHDALRMRFQRRGQAWDQDCLAALDPAAPDATPEVVDLSSLPPDAQRAAMDEAAARLQASLDLSAGPLMRAAVFRLGGGQPGRLLWIIHHLVVDAVSWRVLLPDLGTAYRQLAAGQPVELPAKTTSFQRWAERLHEHARGATFQEERAILTRELAVEPPAPLPVDRPGGRNTREVAAELRVQLSPEETRSLIRDALRPYNLGVQDLLVTALAQAVARFSGSSGVWIDLEGHGREEIFDDVDLSRTVGWFTSLFPVRLRLPSDDPAESLVAVKEQLRAIPRRGIGYGLLRYLHEDGEQLRWPRPEINFNYLGIHRDESGAPGELRPTLERTGPLWAPGGRRSYVLEVNSVVAGGRLEVSFGYSRELHDLATVERLAGDFLAAVRRLIRHCLSAESGRWTPSDFPFVTLEPAELRGLVERLGTAGRSDLEAIYPLIATQQVMLLETLRAEAKDMYMTQIVLDLAGELDAAALRAAWVQVVRRYPLLRSCFVWEGVAEPVQVVLRDPALRWEDLDWRDARDAAELEARLARLALELNAHGIPLDVAPVMRLTLVRIGDWRYKLFWSSHHTLLDGWSGYRIMRDALDFYRAAVEQRPPRDGAAASYEDYLRWLRSRDRARAEDFWRRTLRGFTTPTPLVMARSAPVGEHEYRWQKRYLDADTTARLKAVGDAERVTQHTLIDGAWALLLAGYSGLTDVLFGTVVSGRDEDVPGVEHLVGMFVSVLPTRVRIDADRELWTWLRELQAQQVEGREHHHLPANEIQRCTAVPPEIPLFESGVVFENYPVDAGMFSGAGLKVTVDYGNNPTQARLVLGIIPGRELELAIAYNVKYFDPASVGRLAGHLDRIIRRMLAAPAPRLGELTSLLAAERRHVS